MGILDPIGAVLLRVRERASFFYGKLLGARDFESEQAYLRDRDRRFFGVYRGKVEENVDPLSKRRLLVSVPSVFDAGVIPWALPCVPCGVPAEEQSPPPVGTLVWVAFEAGDPDLPVWLGCFWGA